MKAALFAPTRYTGNSPQGKWPVPVDSYESQVAEETMEWSLRQFELADEVGFDWVSTAEHHYAPFSLTPNPMVLAGAMSQRVRRAKIALLGPTIPMVNPVRVAEEFAMLDTMTGGRVIAGLMRGTPNEYLTYGTNPSESRQRFDEALGLILKAWTEPQPFGWLGRHYEYRSISIWPRPVQSPHPPVYISGSSPDSGELAAKNHLGVGFAVTTLPLARDASRYYREQANAVGWDPTPDDIVYRVGLSLGETDLEAREDFQASSASAARFGLGTPTLNQAVAKAGYWGRDPRGQPGQRNYGVTDLEERIELGQVLVGSPDTVLSQMKRIHDELGAGVFEVIFAASEKDQVLRAIELFGTKVIPRLKEM